MPESYSVNAILSAQDKGFSSAFKNAISSTDSLASKLKSGIGFGVLTGVGQKAFDVLSSGFSGLLGEMNSSSAAWKTFEGNMKMSGHATKEISKVKGELQKFATETIYSSSDMAQTFAQLDAVGVKGTTNLVKGLGGLASAAENPQQAMKTLSQQITQAAAKPAIQWQDFKLMLEQTPAGMAAVAKEMNLSTKELVQNVQSGKVKTEDFFKAISRAAGEGTALNKMAREYKTIGQAMDGLTETIGNKLQPAFDSVSAVGIKAVSGLVDTLSEVDGEKLAANITGAIDRCMKYVSALRESFDGVGSAFGEAFGAIGKSLGKLNGKFGSAKSVDSFRDAMKGVADALKGLAKFIENHSDQIAWLIQQLPKLAAAFVGFKILKTLTGPLFSFGKGIAGLVTSLGGGLAEKLSGVGKAAQTSSKKMLASAKAFALTAVGVLLLAVGFALLAQSSIALAKAGPAAIAVMAGMVAAVAGIMVLMTSLAKSLATISPKKLNAISAAMLAMGAAVLLVSTGFAILAQSAIALAAAGPTAIAVMAGMVVALAGIGAGMVVALQALAPLGAALIPAAASMLILGVAVVVVAAGFALLANTAIKLANAGTTAIAVMGGLVGALAGLMILAAVIGPALTAGAIGLLAFGAAMLLVGAGARLATPLVEALPPVITAIGDAMAQVVPVIADAVTQITTVVGETLCKTFETAAESINTVVTGIGDAVSTVLDSVAGIITSVGEAAKNAGIGFYLLAEGVRNLTELNLLDMGTSLAAVATGIGGIAVASAGLSAAGEGMKNLGIGLVLVQTYAGTAVTALQGIPTALTPLTTTVPSIVPAFLMLSTAVQNFATTALAAFSAIAGGTGVVIPAISSVGTAVMALAVYAGAASGGIGSLTGALATTANGANNLASGARAAQSALSGLTGATNTVQNGIGKLGAVATQAMNQLISAFRQAATQSSAFGRQIGNNLLNGVKSGLNKLPSAATAAMSRFTSAVRSGGARAVSVARSAASSIVSALRSASSGAHSAGVNIGAGLANGMASQLGRVRSIAAQLAAAANAAIRAKAQIHSPSRVTKKSGAYMGQGLANGLKSKETAVAVAAASLASKAMKALTKGTTASKGGYKKLAEKLGKTFKSNLSKVVKKNLKSTKKLIGKTMLSKRVKGINKRVKKALKLTKEGKKLSKELYSAYKDAVKKASDKAVTATQNALTKIGEKYQKKYDAIIEKRKAFYERLSDIGDLYTADDYGYIALKDFRSMTKQIKQYSKNIEKLKQILPDGLMEEILGLDTASGLQLTNHLLGMSSKQIEKWGKNYSAMTKAAKKTSNTYYQPQLDAVKQAFDLAVVKQMQKLDKKLDTIGQNAVQGFINGMNKKMKSLKGSSKKVAKAVVSTLQGELRIHSPSRVTKALGGYTGLGFVEGLDAMASRAADAMKNLVTIPKVQTPKIQAPAIAGGPGNTKGDLNLGGGEIVIVVPVEVDGREIARVTAPYDAEEQEKLQRRKNRRRGKN